MKLIDKHLPADYSDSVYKRIKPVEPLTPDCIFEEMFCNFPKPVDWLFKSMSTTSLSSRPAN